MDAGLVQSRMNVDDIREFCLSFPGAIENLQWGDDLCFKVAKKIFAVVSLGSVPPTVCFKCTPEKFADLCEVDGIGPAPYVGRYKWVLLERVDLLEEGELQELIRASYEMVAAKTKPKTTPKTNTLKRRGRQGGGVKPKRKT